MDKREFLGKLAKQIRFNLDFIVNDKVWAVTEQGDLVNGTIVGINYSTFKYEIEERLGATLPSVKMKKTTIIRVGNLELPIEQFFTDYAKGDGNLVLTKIDKTLPGGVFKTLTEAKDYIKEQEKFKADVEEAEHLKDEEIEEDEDQED